MGLFGKKKKDGVLEKYSVVYKGGRPENPKALSGGIDMKLYSDHFEFAPTMGSKRKWKSYEIPYNTITKLEYVKRTLGKLEALATLGDSSTASIETLNNINITHNTDSGELVLRMEMLTGVHVAVQAQKCQELEDKLRTHGIRSQFIETKNEESRSAAVPDIAEQIEKLGGLLEKGLINQEEFDQKKTELLSKL
jgi:hypothetical protein